MGRKTTPVQILLALEKVCKVDMNNFRYKMQSGRLWNDYDIMKELGSSKLSYAIEEIGHYMGTYRASFAKESLAELKKKGWITPTAIAKAKRIVTFIAMKKGTHIIKKKK